MKTVWFQRAQRAAVILLISLFALTLFGCKDNEETVLPTGETEGTPAASSEVPDEFADYQLYYNYSAAHSEDGMTLREVDKTDGYYHVLVAGDGRSVELRVEKKKLVSTMDRLKVFAAKLDENRVVEDVKTIDEVAGGYLYYNVYITEVDGRHFTLNMSATGHGYSMELDLPEDVPVYNVSEYSEVRGLKETKFYASDKISVVQNRDGSVKSVYIVERVPGIEANHVHCLCTDECREFIPDHVCEEIRFAPWNVKDKMPTDTGYYFLNCDMELSGQSTTNEGAQVVICLNGHKVQGMLNRRIFSVFKPDSSLVITDCQKTPGYVKGLGNTDQGSLIWVAYGSCTIYAGTYDASDMVTRDHDGSGIALQPNTEFTMYGGTFIGGQTAPHHFGGSVYVHNNSVFRMYGGVIRDGRVPDSSGGNIFIKSGGKCYLYGGTIQGGQGATGGNICVLPNGYLEIGENCKIMGGRATSYITDTGSSSGGHGGNISNSGEIVMNGGIISGGRTDDNGGGGGNVSVLSNTGKLTVNGGIISGGSGKSGGGILTFYAPNGGEGPTVVLNGGMVSGNEARTGAGGNAYVSAGTLTITNGTVTNGQALNSAGGNVSVAKAGRFYMTGGMLMNGESKSGGNLRLEGVAEISGGTIRDGIAEYGGNSEDANVQIYGDDADLTLSGGIIAGGLLLGKGRITFKGSPKVASSASGFTAYPSVEKQNIVFDALNEDAVLYVSGTGVIGTVSGAFTADRISCIRPVQDGKTARLSGNQVVIE